ncbi:XRE family transcriptional regulator [Rhizobium leucaenae]|uniref:XRE family transcriptional regulator n=1 Tax=Rhizobium leucaenae TaxID=29450 RepID=UPI001619B6B3|nr:XRE family transcriptional regulator [Rhizobium leucaenae]MBB6299956.1 phage repressor protein C with HTH and peptisase S24 domain [Rhizobium leucaenae]
MTGGKSRFSQMLIDRQKQAGMTDKQIADRYNWIQQTFNRWKIASLPRKNMFPSIANFLGITPEEVERLVEDAATTENAVKNVSIFGMANIHGAVSDRKTGKYKFRRPGRHATAIPTGRYAIMIQTEVMMPALVAGSKAWVDPSVTPRLGNDVMVHADGGKAWVGQLRGAGKRGGTTEVTITQHAAGTMVIRDVQAIHVIVLSERVSSWSD